jgi:beta-phosphoglucomutase-like phosphatase (HAD superfamily)
MTYLNVLNQHLFTNGSPSRIVADFDGVLAHSNTQLILDVSYKVISKYHNYDYDTFKSIFSSLVPFPLYKSVDFLLEAMGLTHVKGELSEALMTVDGGIEDAKKFIEYCAEKNIPLNVLSSGDLSAKKYNSLIEILGSENVIANPNFSKINPYHYENFRDKLNIVSNNTLYIDDCPVALNSAKLAGFKTALMTNGVFSSGSLSPDDNFIDIIFTCWDDALIFLNGDTQDTNQPVS